MSKTENETQSALSALNINEEQQNVNVAESSNNNTLTPPLTKKRRADDQTKPTISELISKMDGINATLNDLNTKFQGFAITSYRKDLEIEKAITMLENKIMNQLGKITSEQAKAKSEGGGVAESSTSGTEKKDDMAWLHGSAAEEQSTRGGSDFRSYGWGRGRGRVHKNFNKFSRGKFYNRRY